MSPSVVIARVRDAAALGLPVSLTRPEAAALAAFLDRLAGRRPHAPHPAAAPPGPDIRQRGAA